MFKAENCVLLLVDVQGQLAQLMQAKERLFRSLEVMLNGMKIMGVPILWMEQIPSKLGPTIESLRKIMEGQTPIEKNSFSCCGEPRFMNALNSLKKNQVIITGIEAHICVLQTTYELLDKGYDVQVAVDCVSSRISENKEVALKRIMQAGGELTTVEMLFFELLGSAEGDIFKKIVNLIK